MKNLVRIVAFASALTLVVIFYINYNNVFTNGNLAVNHKHESKTSKIKRPSISTQSQEFKSTVVIEEKEGFITPCFHHSQN